MKIFILQAAKFVLTVLYAPLKLFPTNRKKVLFLSRQSSTLPMDFALLQKELLEQDPDLLIVSICNRIGPGLGSKASYALDLLRSMYHLATAHVCVLDSYWPAVSVLKHKSDLVVVQIWHALGKVKQSGLISVGRPGGRSKDVAEAMCMHENYDYIIAGAKFWNPFYCDSFGCDEDQIINVGLPRLDWLSSPMEETAAEIHALYPQLKDRPVVLYVPTFRRDAEAQHEGLIAALSKLDCTLVVKAHPNQEIDAGEALTCPEFSGMQMLAVADCAITDYSAIALEAAAHNVKTLYYLYDKEEYRENTGLNIDVSQEMPELVHYTVPSLVEGLEAMLRGGYPQETLDRYREKYLLPELGHSTADLVDFILGFVRR